MCSCDHIDIVSPVTYTQSSRIRVPVFNHIYQLSLLLWGHPTGQNHRHLLTELQKFNFKDLILIDFNQTFPTNDESDADPVVLNDFSDSLYSVTQLAVY
jgi:hypothetical protein